MTVSTAEHVTKRLSEVTRQYMTEVKKPVKNRKMIRTSSKRGRSGVLPDLALNENAAISSSVDSRNASRYTRNDSANKKNLYINFEGTELTDLQQNKTNTPLRSLRINNLNTEAGIFRTPPRGVHSHISSHDFRTQGKGRQTRTRPTSTYTVSFVKKRNDSL